MRDIKFRAWNIVTKRMLDLKKMTPLALNMDTNGLFIPFSDGLPLMQFTGLKDKNGNEIYEGDVLKVDDSDDVDKWFRGEIGEVQYIPARFSLCLKNGDKKTIVQDFQDYVTIIGNIHENPELLTPSPQEAQ